MENKKVFVKVRNLRQWFPVKNGFWGRKKWVRAVDDVSFDLYSGETLGICGESGCGKSTLIRTMLRIIEPTQGSIEYDGMDITHMGKKEISGIRKNMQIVFQDPYSSLDSRWTVGSIIEEPLLINKIGMTKQERQERVRELMQLVGLDTSYVHRYPHEFSGGQRQRIAIARSLAINPKLLMLDEAVSALDVSVRAQILNLLDELQQQLQLTYVFVSHDMSVIEHICDRVIIMYLGRIMEIGKKEDIFSNPAHPYTKALLSAIPMVHDENIKRERIRLEGDIPSPIHPPAGCRFHTRCPHATEQCQQEPLAVDLGNDHKVFCCLYQ